MQLWRYDEMMDSKRFKIVEHEENSKDVYETYEDAVKCATSMASVTESSYEIWQKVAVVECKPVVTKLPPPEPVNRHPLEQELRRLT